MRRRSMAGGVAGTALFALLHAPPAWAAEVVAAASAEPALLSQWPWWVLVLTAFAFTSVLGVLAVLAGIGGGVLFVPLVAAFAPFVHLDFVRGAGLMVALTGALAAGPGLIRANLASVRLALPISLTASMGAVVGAQIGLALPVDAVQVMLGAIILGVAVLLLVGKPSETRPDAPRRGLDRILAITETYWDAGRGEQITWRPHGLNRGMVMFAGVGVLAGMFGLGAGWANVPVLNLLMGVPLRVAVATSYFLLAITDTAAALIYFHRGAIVPLLVVPSVLGIMVGARIGSHLLMRLDTALIRRIVIVVLLLAGARALLRGLGY